MRLSIKYRDSLTETLNTMQAKKVNSLNIQADGGSQTLARGLAALEIIGHAAEPISVATLSQQLGIHRSMAYRLVKTLEQSGFVARATVGGLVLGPKLATLARGVSKDLRSAAAPELAAIAEALEMTAFCIRFDLLKLQKDLCFVQYKHKPLTDLQPKVGDLIAKSHDWLLAFTSGRYDSISSFAADKGVSSEYVLKMIYLGCMAPDLAMSFLDQSRSSALDASDLMSRLPLPENWTEQREIFRI